MTQTLNPLAGEERRDAARERTIVTRDAAPLAGLRSFPMSPYSRCCQECLFDSGRKLLLAAACDSWLFVWIVDVESGTIESRISMPGPGRLSRFFRIALTRDALWVLGHDDVIEIARDGWRIRSWRPFRDLLPAGAIVEQLSLFPHSRYLWVGASTPVGTYVIDLDSWTLARPLVGVSPWVQPVPGAPEPMVFSSEDDEGPMLFRPDGRPVPGSELPLDFQTRSLAVTPDLQGFVSLELLDCPEAEIELAKMVLRRVVLAAPGAPTEDAAAGPTFERFVLDGATHRGSYDVLTSLDESLCFVLIHPWRGKDRKHLLALSISPRAFRLRYRVRVPFDTRLVQDRRGRRVAAIFTDRRGMNVLPLGRRRPALDHLSEDLFDRDSLFIPSIDLDRHSHCGEPTDESGQYLSLPLAREVEQMPTGQRRSFIRHFEAAYHDDAEELASLYHALGSGWLAHRRRREREIEEERQEILRILKKHLPEHPAVALLTADEEAVAGRWQEVRRWLRVAEAGGLNDNRAFHVHHLRGLVHLHEGRPDDAFEEFRKATRDRRRSECYLHRLLELTEPMAQPPGPDDWGPGQAMLRQVLGALRTANRALAAGDAEGVLSALDRPVFWQQFEVQTAARLAAVFLESEAAGETERFEKRFALAFFRESFESYHDRREIRLPGVSWEGKRLERLDGEVRAWLDDG